MLLYALHDAMVKRMPGQPQAPCLRGTLHQLMKERVADVEIQDPLHVSFKLKQPWPDFLTFYAGATGAGWIVPKKYVAKVGNDGFRKAPVGAGPYRFVSFNAGVEVVLEAFDQYWRKSPSVKPGPEGGSRTRPRGWRR
jgi:peptide/nickel transport system substrate-binding protein